MPFALVSLYCFDDDTMKKNPNIRYFDKREDAVNVCKNKLIPYNPDDPWTTAYHKVIEEHLANHHHGPLTNYCGGSGTSYMIRESADSSKETRISLFQLIENHWCPVSIWDLKVAL